jgi:NAD(P)-dependent dehydrogenase (short-subunit alcohol dehydrogenase family)
VQNFSGKLAVVTGAGSGIGRQLALQLAADGCNLALCDLHMEALSETKELCASSGLQVSVHSCDVSDEEQVNGFAKAVLSEHHTDHINLLFNNAGLSGGGSFLNDSRQEWERTFTVCWGGVYLCCRAFMPLLVASEEGHLVNVSSVNGFWASLSANFPHTAYSAAKFAVKGFTEALITDLKVNAPHVGVSVVMPGHIGTNIVINSRDLQGSAAPADMNAEECEDARKLWSRIEPAAADFSDDDVRALVEARGEMFRDSAPTTAAQAATIILGGVRENQWRILVGDDAVGLDELVREKPGQAYSNEFFEELQSKGVFNTIAT